MERDMNTSIGAALARIQADAEALSRATIHPAVRDDAAPRDELPSFTDHLKAAIYGVNEKDRIAAEKMAEVDSGRSDDLVGAMLASQEASLSFSMLMQVRNKIVGAVDELIKLQL